MSKTKGTNPLPYKTINPNTEPYMTLFERYSAAEAIKAGYKEYFAKLKITKSK